ncbi:aminopeptidase P family protein [bacterium]|nr:aminopeptidase P family protein [bacterium]
MSSAVFRKSSEAALFSDPTSLRYLTGARFTSGTALVSPTRKILLVDGRYLFKARRILGRKWHVLKTPRDQSAVPAQIKSLGIRRLYIDTEMITAARYRSLLESMNNGIQLFEARGLADRIRSVKRPEELAAIREAVRRTDVIWARLHLHLRIGMTERDILNYIKQEAHRLGAEEMSFEPIVASGPETAEPHAEASDKKIRGDEPLMVDMGIRLGGYCSDFTRTVFLLRRRRRPPAWFTAFWREVLAIQNLAYGLLSRGEREPKVIARKIAIRIRRKRLGRYYLHGLGHGVGLNIHEEPYMTEKGPRLKNGMVFTVEPGLYRAGRGGVRIEDMACINRDRLEILTQSPKELIWRI